MKKHFRLPRKIKKLFKFSPANGNFRVKKYKNKRRSYLNYLRPYTYFKYSQIGLNILKCIRKELTPYNLSLWGVNYKDRYKLVSHIEGDGLQVVRLVSLKSRPFGYIVRIDSSHDVESDNFNYEILLCITEEEYGRYYDFEAVQIDGIFKYVFCEDMDEDGNFDPETAFIKDEEPFDDEGVSWHSIAIFKNKNN